MQLKLFESGWEPYEEVFALCPVCQYQANATYEDGSFYIIEHKVFGEPLCSGSDAVVPPPKE